MGEIKKCTTCGKDKDVSNFYFYKGVRTYKSTCKDCLKKYRKEYHIKNKEKHNVRDKKYYEDHKKERKEYDKSRYYNDFDYRIGLYEKNRIRQEGEGRSEYLEYMKDYYEKNKEKYLKRNKKYFKNNYWTNIKFRISKILRNRVYLALRAKNVSKNKKIMELIGCSVEFFIDYTKSKFTKGMSWEELMEGNIHIDHIKPLALFNLVNENEQKKAFHYTNMQPLWAKDNLSKGKKYE